MALSARSAPLAYPLARLALLGVFACRNPFILCLPFILFTFFRLHEAFPVLNPLRLPNLLAISSLLVLGAWVTTRRLRLAWAPELKIFGILFGLVTLGVPLASGRDIASPIGRTPMSRPPS